MAKEKNLTSITTVAAADFARIVTSAGASVKATAANLAKYIVETYNGSTVAGSAQSVKSALDSLNSNTNGSGALETQSSWTMLAYSYVQLYKLAFVKIEATSTDTSTSWVTVASGYPAPQRNYYCQIATPQGACKARINTSGQLAIANSQGVNGCKIDTIFPYPLV